MGVYIKCMEMPKRGHTTTITIVGSGKAYVEYFDCRPHVKETIEYTAVPVPPHGRLIDADALCEGRVSNDNVVICAKCAPTIIEAEEGE